MKTLIQLICLLIVLFCWSCRTGTDKGSDIDTSSTNNLISTPPQLPNNADTLSIASWNIQIFGQTKLNDPELINIIIDIIKRYDIIAIQEVRDASLQLPTQLIEIINADGLNYNVVASERLGRSRMKEQYLFVYNDDLLDVVEGTMGYGVEPNDEFAREPFYCMFRADSFDFYLLTIHTDPDDVDVEIPALKTAYLNLQNNTDNLFI